MSTGVERVNTVRFKRLICKGFVGGMGILLELFSESLYLSGGREVREKD